ncbi:Hypothetical predicted protein [Cloeon dipterum]|uniref:C-type lectin domain-containing protein n=1 Tax=Cloeon dipterum TaxID=197152 RepID=A0A8S1E585_9INSE|nr:Hypothetical predicted protein [Cloeon dipterum]
MHVLPAVAVAARKLRGPHTAKFNMGAPHKFLIFILLLTYMLCVEGSKTNRMQRNRLKAKRRNTIIKCCGKDSCVAPKNVSRAKRTTAPTSSSTTKSLTSFRIRTTSFQFPVTTALDANIVLETTNQNPQPSTNDQNSAHFTGFQQQQAPSSLAGSENVSKADAPHETNFPTTEFQLTTTTAIEDTKVSSTPTSQTNQNIIAGATDTDTSVQSGERTTTADNNEAGGSSSGMTASETTDAKPNSLVPADVNSTARETSTTDSTNTPWTFTTEKFSPWRTAGTKPVTTATPAPLNFPKCASNCNKNTSLFGLDGSLNDMSSYGIWVEMCGKLYLFGRRFMNWEQNVEQCCHLGMTPIDLDLDADFKCVASLTSNDDYRNRISRFYWTYGLRRSENAVSSYLWCNNGNNITKNWAGGEPNYKDKAENCVRMEMVRGDRTVRLSDVKCSAISVFSCQGPKIPTPCTSPVCPNYICNRKDSIYKTLADRATKYMINQNQQGIWIKNMTRVIMISFPNDTKTFVDSFSACCAVGLKLLSLHQDLMFSYLVGAFKRAGISGEKFWTSATDAGCKYNFGFCSTKRLLRDHTRWAKGQPDLSVANGTCVAVTPDGLLHDELCTSKMRYVCDGRVQKSSLFDSVERECAQEFNFTESEVKIFFNSTPTDLRAKCFLKCYGEGTGLFVDGNLAEDKIFANFQRMTLDNLAQLMEMSNTMDFCTKSAKGMDPCDKSSSLLSCGQENAPDSFGEFVDTVELSITEPPLILTPEEGVCPQYDCVVQISRKQYSPQLTCFK